MAKKKPIEGKVVRLPADVMAELEVVRGMLPEYFAKLYRGDKPGLAESILKSYKSEADYIGLALITLRRDMKESLEKWK